MLFSVLLEFSLTNGQDVVYSLLEERDTDYLIGNIARDSNLSSFIINTEDLNNMKYSFLTQGNSNTDYFRINNKTSDFYTTAKKLDREKICAFRPTCEIVLDVIAQSTIGTFFKKVGVKVLLQDINDNKPTFSTNETSLQFSESSVFESSQPLEGATDPDSGSNSVQTYSILEKDTPFSVDFQKFVDGSSTVALILKGKLDRETKDFYELTIVAKDGGFESKNGTLKVYVAVTDVNDNTPIFEKPTYNVTINESTTIGKVILDVSAVDPDLGNNGKISYRLSPHQDNLIRSKFVVNATTGDLSINQSLLYESGKFYKVIIEASDHGNPPLISQTTVFVYILDSVNDPPTISINLLSNSDKAKIAENASRGAAVAHVEVTDRDTGTNGNFDCTVDNHFFKLDSLESDNSKTREFKVVVDKPLDREDIDTHTVRVLCQDEGSPPKTSTAQFYVIVLDENDHAPAFGQENFIAYVDENNNIGASITQVLASDADKGINAQVVFSLTNLQGHDFRIDPNSGHIFVHFQLDRENISQYTFNVVATDKGSSPKSSSARVIVIVKDKNDNKPKFSQDIFTFEMLENQEVNSFIGRVYANDPDEKENGTVEFILSPENSVDLPFVVLKNGTIYNVEVLNHETKPHGYHFNIIAMDGGNPRLNSTARVTIFVNDQNDNDPIILFPNVNNRSVTILYDVAVKSLITKVKAIDMDTGLNAKLTYSIVDSQMKHIFHMNPETGEITLVRPLTMDDIKSYTFSILVEDRGIPKRYAEENLTIVVISQGLIPSGQSGEQDYLLIVVVILCVTVLLSGAIILIICLIKVKRINFNQKKSPKPVKNHTYQNGINKEMYDAIGKNLENDSKNPAEKKVSFSLENLADESSTDFPVDRATHQIPPLPSSDVQEVSTIPASFRCMIYKVFINS